MAIIIITSVIILLLTSLLFSPIQLVIDSSKQKYLIKMPIYFSARLVPENQLFYFKIRLLFIPFKINPFKTYKEKAQKETKPGKRKMPNFLKSRLSIVHKAFTISRLYANIDTGNFPLNAQLMPLTVLNSYNNINININFENKNEADIKIITRLYSILAAGISK